MPHIVLGRDANAAPAPTPAPIYHAIDRRAAPTPVAVSGYTYLGCYVDVSTRVLAFEPSYSGDMLPELCRGLCQQIGQSVFGLEFGAQCWCSSALATDAALATADSDCSQSCPGNTNAACGGTWRMNVYSPTATTTATGGSTTTASTTPGNSTAGSSPTSSAGVGSTATTRTSAGSSATGGGSGANPPSSVTDVPIGSTGTPVVLPGNDATSSSNSDKLSAGAIAGVSLTAALVAGLLGAGIALWLYRRRLRKRQQPPPGVPPGFLSPAAKSTHVQNCEEISEMGSPDPRHASFHHHRPAARARRDLIIKHHVPKVVHEVEAQHGETGYWEGQHRESRI